MAGHVKTGESYEEAARRELAEELGVEQAELVFLGRLTRLDHVTPTFAEVRRVVLGES